MVLGRVEELRRARTPFVLATVVRAQRPTSAKPGDRALVLADGTIEGFVGGDCASSTVRLEGLRLLETGSAVLLRISPFSFAEEEGLLVVNNPCHSGGTLEIFLEPFLPAPLIYVYGDSPIAQALTAIGKAAGYDMVSGFSPGASAVVVASHGGDEQPVLAQAVRAGVPYIALVASHKRGDAVLAEAGLERERIHTPAGLDIGARTAGDVAISILAEIISNRVASRPEVKAPAVAIDPVCHMEVAITPGAIAAQGHYFCSEGCRRAFLNE